MKYESLPLASFSVVFEVHGPNVKIFQPLCSRTTYHMSGYTQQYLRLMSGYIQLDDDFNARPIKTGKHVDFELNKKFSEFGRKSFYLFANYRGHFYISIKCGRNGQLDRAEISFLLFFRGHGNNEMFPPFLWIRSSFFWRQCESQRSGNAAIITDRTGRQSFASA